MGQIPVALIGAACVLVWAAATLFDPTIERETIAYLQGAAAGFAIAAVTVAIVSK